MAVYHGSGGGGSGVVGRFHCSNGCILPVVTAVSCHTMGSCEAKDTVKYVKNLFLFEFLARNEPKRPTTATTGFDIIDSNTEKDNTTRSARWATLKIDLKTVVNFFVCFLLLPKPHTLVWKKSVIQ